MVDRRPRRTTHRSWRSPGTAVLTSSAHADPPWQEAATASSTKQPGSAQFVPGEESATDRLAIYNQQLGAQSADNDSIRSTLSGPVLSPSMPLICSHHVEAWPRTISRQLSKTTPSMGIWLVCRGTRMRDCLTGEPIFSRNMDSRSLRRPGPNSRPGADDSGRRKGRQLHFRGLVWQGLAYEGLTCDALEWQYSNGGGSIIEPDGTVTINNPQAIAAFERARDWVGAISPEDVTTFDEPGRSTPLRQATRRSCATGRTAYTVTQAPGSTLIGKVGVSQLPRRRRTNPARPRLAAGSSWSRSTRRARTRRSSTSSTSVHRSC